MVNATGPHPPLLEPFAVLEESDSGINTAYTQFVAVAWVEAIDVVGAKGIKRSDSLSISLVKPSRPYLEQSGAAFT